MNLTELKENEKGIIVKIKGRGSFRKRILEMGFIKGKVVEYVKQAPLSDPIVFRILDSEISLRKSEASLIEIIPLNEIYSQETNKTNAQTFEYIENKIQDLSLHQAKTIQVALVGNPNCGKTTLFNYCTGLSEHVGNYSGVTVDIKKGIYKFKDYIIELTDMPGTYSLSSYSPEERFVRDHLLNNYYDIIINVIDSSNIERNLFLTTQLIDMDLRVVIALNMYDELLKRKDRFDYEKFGSMIGIPIVPTVSNRGRGIYQLFEQVVDLYEDKSKIYRHIHINYGENIENAIRAIQQELKQNKKLLDRYSSRFIAIKLLEKDTEIEKLIEQCPNYWNIIEVAHNQIEILEKDFNENTESIITDAKYGFIEGALKENYYRNKEKVNQIGKKIDKIFLNRVLGLPIFFLLLWGIFELTFTLGEYPVTWINNAVELVSNFIQNYVPESVLKDLIVDGVIKGVGGVFVFLPNILLLFFFIAILEDTGYMARAAFIMDKVMHIIGLHGKSFIPLFMGFGCNVPAIMTTRTIESRNDRIVTMLINPFMSCSARLPIFVLITGTFFSKYAGTILFLIYLTGILLAGLIALLFKKTVFKKNEVPFVMELPPYRIPTLRNIMKHMWQKARQYLKKMSGIILTASIIIWTLSYFPYGRTIHQKINQVKQQYHQTNSIKVKQELEKKYHQYHAFAIENSYLGKIGKCIEPIMKPLGFDWRITVSLITGITGKEVVVSTMAVLFNANGLNQNNNLKESLIKAANNEGKTLFDLSTVVAFIMFVLVYFPCIGVIAAINKETATWKWPLFEIFFTTSLAWILSFIIKNIVLWLH